MAFRAQSGAYHFDDRKLSYRLVMAIDAKLPIHCQRLAARGFHGRLAMKASVTPVDNRAVAWAGLMAANHQVLKAISLCTAPYRPGEVSPVNVVMRMAVSDLAQTYHIGRVM